MSTRKDALSRLAKLVVDTRSEIRAGLEVVEKDLRESMNGLNIYASGKQVWFGQVDEGVWEYGMLNFDGSNLRILTSDTMEDALYHGTPYAGMMKHRYISDFKNDENLTKLASPDSIDSLWTALEERIREKLGEAKSAARLLSEFSDEQSESIHTDLTGLMQGDYFEKQWASARLAIDVDASDSLTRTTQFLESVCRHYLDKRQIPLGNKKTISEFINAVTGDFPPLLLPDGTEHSQDIRSLLGGVKSIAQGTGTLRTHLGTAHGGNKFANADEARLSNNLAGAVAIYILQKLKAHMSAG